MCGRTWEPSPRSNRPAEISWMSFASTATFIGLRANATAIEDCSPIRSVALAARARETNASCRVYGTLKPS